MLCADPPGAGRGPGGQDLDQVLLVPLGALHLWEKDGGSPGGAERSCVSLAGAGGRYEDQAVFKLKMIYMTI